MLAPEPKSAVCWGTYEGEKGLSAVAGVSVGRSLEGRNPGGEGVVDKSDIVEPP